MFDMIPFPTQSNIGNITDLAAAPYQLATIFARRNNIHGHVPMADKTGAIFTAAVASGAGVTLATITALKFPIVSNITVAASTTGRFQLLYNAVVFAELKLIANQSLPLTFPPYGLFFNTNGQSFTFVNQTGAASDLSGSIAYAESGN